jgi:hypothetical protein
MSYRFFLYEKSSSTSFRIGASTLPFASFYMIIYRYYSNIDIRNLFYLFLLIFLGDHYKGASNPLLFGAVSYILFTG